MAAIELHTSTDAKPAAMVDLFSIDDTMYQIPAKPKVNIALKFLRMARTQGMEIASGWLLEELLGEDAFEALMNYDDLTAEDMEQVMAVAQEVTLGAVEASQAPLGNGSPKRSPAKRSNRG